VTPRVQPLRAPLQPQSPDRITLGGTGMSAWRNRNSDNNRADDDASRKTEAADNRAVSESAPEVA